ncbi:hypothetical protein UFOVP184_7 [uncultured Caudovirales phage]|uniref:Uncharacterized protein n=1 Tax=uncultured Caudovirales phage TaxID=2100421 RepID=A0A6J7WGC1_9CAUD|nr:hypothetical protein UFOVP184_7 [uncultured Caudovirales phage]
MLRDLQLWIDGKYIDVEKENIRFESLVVWSKDSIPILHLTHFPVFPVPVDPWINKTVVLFLDDGSVDTDHGYVDPTGSPSDFPDQPWWKIVFLGQMARRVNASGSSGWSYGYEARGVDYLASQWPIVSPFDGTGQANFNLPTTDPMYDSTFANLNLAEMILLILEEYTTAKHFYDLANLITDQADPWPRDISISLGRYRIDNTQVTPIYKIDERTRIDLLGDPYLTAIIAPKPITFAGDDFMQGIRNLLQAVAPNHAMWIEPVLEAPPDGGSKKPFGIIRFRNAATRITELPMSMAIDPAPQVQRDYGQSFSRVVVRGGPNIVPVELSMNKGEIIEDFGILPWFTSNNDAKAQWKLSVSQVGVGRQVFGNCMARRPRSASNPNEISPTLPDPANPNLTIANPDYIANITDPKLTSASFILFTPTQALLPANGSLVPGAAAERNLTWAAGVWGQNSNCYMGNLVVNWRNPINLQYNGSTSVRIVDNTATVGGTNANGGGTCYLTLQTPLTNTDTMNGTLTASMWPGRQTWRRYRINANMPDGTPLAKRVQPAFTSNVTWTANVPGVTTPAITVGNSAGWVFSGSLTPQRVSMVVDRQTQDIIFTVPVVTLLNSDLTDLNNGGVGVKGQPTEIRVILPVAGNALEAAAPPDLVANVPAGTLNPPTTPQYRGTSFTVDGLKRTRYINNRDWVSEIDRAMMAQWASQQLDTVCDTVIEGQAIKIGVKPVVGCGTYVTWSDPCWDTSSKKKFDFLTSDVVASTIHWLHGSGDAPVVTTYTLTNRRNPYADQSGMVFHPCMYPSSPREVQHTDWFDPMSALPRANTNAIEDKRAMDLATKTWDVDPNEASRLRNAGLGFTQTAEQLGAEAVQMSGEEARKATLNAVIAAQEGTLNGDGQGWSGKFHTAGGDIETGYGTDGNSYKPGGAK